MHYSMCLFSWPLWTSSFCYALHPTSLSNTAIPTSKASISAYTPPSSLNLTVIGAAHGESTLECWQLAAPFVLSNSSGVAGAAFAPLVAEAKSVSFGVLPPVFNGGLHNAPTVQYVVFTSGLAHITLPAHPSQEAWIRGGRHGLILVLDTADVSARGHGTDYPGHEPTTAIQIPIANGTVPAHRVLHDGPCAESQIPP